MKEAKIYRDAIEQVLGYIKENKAKQKILATLEAALREVDEAPKEHRPRKQKIQEDPPREDIGQPLPETNEEPIPLHEDDDIKQRPQPEDVPEFDEQ